MSEKVKKETKDVKSFFGNIANNFETNVNSFTSKIVNAVKGTNIKYDKIDEDSNDKIEKLKEVFKTGRDSDDKALNYVIEAFQYEIGNGNEECKKLLNSLIKAKTENPNFVIRADTDWSLFCRADHKDGTILQRVHFNSDTIDNKQYDTALHEIGHLLHFQVSNFDFGGIGWDDVVGSYNNLVTDGWDVYVNGLWNDFTQTEEKVNKEFYESKGMDEATYRDFVINKIKDAKTNSIYNLFKKFNVKAEEQYNVKTEDNSKNYNAITKFIFDKMGIDETIYSMLDETNITDEELADKYIYDEKRQKVRDISLADGVGSLMDITDALSEGSFKDRYPTSFGHGSSYYNSNLDSIVSEMVANYTNLKTSGNEKAIIRLRQMVGDSLVNKIDAIYNQNVNY